MWRRLCPATRVAGLEFPGSILQHQGDIYMKQQMNAMKQMVEMQKVAFGSMMNAGNMIMDQSDAMLNSALGLANWMPKEIRNAITQQAENQRQAIGCFKQTVEAGFDNLNKFFGSVNGEL
jgi:hypothetical protein